MVVIVAHRYGWVPDEQQGAEGKSITWLECDEAHRCAKELLIFLVDQKHPWPEDPWSAIPTARAESRKKP